MSLENPFWGATKIHGESLKLGLQTWKIFVRNHMEGIASIDLFVVPTRILELPYPAANPADC